jgi:hypothetical protein
MSQISVTSIDTPDFEKLFDYGFSIFPLPRGEKAPASHWRKYQNERASLDEVAAWDDANLNVAVVTGAISNIVVLDVDSADGQAFLDRFDLPQTPTVVTSKGRHYYFRRPATPLRNTVRVEGVGLDVRADGGYVVGAGSKHPDGTIYRWEMSPDDAPFADLPDAVLSFLTKSPSHSAIAHSAGEGEFVEAGPFSTFLNKEVQEALTELRAHDVEGDRNNTLFRLAARVANHVAALGLDWTPIAHEFRSVALAIGLAVGEADAALASAWKTGSATPTKWIEVAREWIFVGGSDQFWSPRSNQWLARTAFSPYFADTMPFKKTPPAKFLLEGGLITKVVGLRFEPSQPTGVYEKDGIHFYNSYAAPEIEPTEGDPAPLIEFLEYLVPEAAEREHLVKMIAWTVAHPGEKLTYALLLQSKKHGVGKSTLIDIWRQLLGPSNTRKTNSEEMSGNYQSYLADTILVVLEELNLGSGIQVYNRLKDMITGETAIINEKYVKQREVPNTANFVFLSNLTAPLLIEQNDRRFFVIDSPADPRPASYWSEFQKWWRDNLGVVKRYFDSVDLKDFAPYAPPPETPAKERLKRHSESPLVQELKELVDNRLWPFDRDVLTQEDIKSALKLRGHGRETPQKLALAMREAGFEPLGQHRVDGSQSRGSFWACRNGEDWLAASGKQISDEYKRLEVAQ